MAGLALNNNSSLTQKSNYTSWSHSQRESSYSLSRLITRFIFKNKTTSTIKGPGTAYTSGIPGFTPGFK